MNDATLKVHIAAATAYEELLLPDLLLSFIRE
jgi:hypothetical protein